MLTPRPFLKWAGGKSQLIEQIESNLPSRFTNSSISKYAEPFIGGGALFFHLAHKYHIQELFISDINEKLVIAYKAIHQDTEGLISALYKIEKEFLALDDEGRAKYYSQTREDYNTQKMGCIETASCLIFLNKTCFNGLYRVNSKGDFNVPMGRYKNPKICDEENLRAIAPILQKTQIHTGDFTQCRDWVDSKTLVYFDPPYRPISNTSNFKSYAQQLFGDSEQLRLRDFFKECDRKGAYLLLSNSDPKNGCIADNFFESAYDGYHIQRVKATRNINSDRSKRGVINELLICNYKNG